MSERKEAVVGEAQEQEEADEVCGVAIDVPTVRGSCMAAPIQLRIEIRSVPRHQRVEKIIYNIT